MGPGREVAAGEEVAITVTLRCEPTGPARSGRPDDRLREPRRATARALWPCSLRGPLRGHLRMTEYWKRLPSCMAADEIAAGEGGENNAATGLDHCRCCRHWPRIRARLCG